jgi:hypothetical protein
LIILRGIYLSAYSLKDTTLGPSEPVAHPWLVYPPRYHPSLRHSETCYVTSLNSPSEHSLVVCTSGNADQSLHIRKTYSTETRREPPHSPIDPASRTATDPVSRSKSVSMYPGACRNSAAQLPLGPYSNSKSACAEGSTRNSHMYANRAITHRRSAGPTRHRVASAIAPSAPLSVQNQYCNARGCDGQKPFRDSL